MILKKGLLTELEKNKKKDSQQGNIIFWVGSVFGGYVGALQANIFKDGLIL